MKAFSFFENWYQLAESQTDDAKRLAFYDAVMRFAFDGEVPENVGRNGDGVRRAAYFAYLTVQPVLELSRKRSAATDSVRKNQAEKSSGKSSGKSNGKSNPDLIKIKDARSLEKNRIEENRIEENSSSRVRAMPPLKEFVEGCFFAGIPRDFAAELYGEISTNGWADSAGKPIGNWRMYAKRVYSEQRQAAPGVTAPSAAASPTITQVDLADYD
jgi:hypothetical protein